jgi:hypothetical protein
VERCVTLASLPHAAANSHADDKQSAQRQDLATQGKSEPKLPRKVWCDQAGKCHAGKREADA